MSGNENEQQDDVRQDDARREGEQPESKQPEAQAADEQMAGQLATLREMQKSEDHLDKTMNEARDAVQAADEADSMRLPGTEGYDAEEEGPQPSG